MRLLLETIKKCCDDTIECFIYCSDNTSIFGYIVDYDESFIRVLYKLNSSKKTDYKVSVTKISIITDIIVNYDLNNCKFVQITVLL